MAAHSDLIPVTIWLPEDVLVSVAMIADKRGHKAPEEISQLVNRALHAPSRKRVPEAPLGRSEPTPASTHTAAARRPPQPLPTPARPPAARAEEVSDSASIAMLAALFSGSSIQEIAVRFEISADVAAAHLAYLQSVNPRARRNRDNSDELRLAS